MKIHVNGINVHYEYTGRKNAPVVMLCHSLSATLAMWDAQMAALSEGYQVLRYDLRGHGESDAPSGPYDFDMLAGDAVGLLRALNIARCHFVGLSIGGMIGQALALSREQEIASLALCATTSRMPIEMQPVWDERIRGAMENGMASLKTGTLERWFTAGFRARQPSEVARVGRMIEMTPMPGYAGCAQAIKMLNFTDQLLRINLPTLVIVGCDDPGTPVAASQAIQREINGAQLSVLDDAMHICNIEQAEGFNRALLDFLAEQEPRHSLP